MTQEALKLALEALDAMANEGWLLCGPEGLDNAQTKCVEAITAIKEALAQPEQKPATYSAWGLMGGDKFVNKDSLNRNIT